MAILVKPWLLIVKFWFQWKAIICQRPSSIEIFFISSPFHLFSCFLFYLLFFLFHPVSQEIKSATWVDTSSNFSQLFTDPCWGKTYFLLSELLLFRIIYSSFYLCYYTFFYHTFLFLSKWKHELSTE